MKQETLKMYPIHFYENPPQAPLLSSPSISISLGTVHSRGSSNTSGWSFLAHLAYSSLVFCPFHLHKTHSFLLPIPDYSPGSYDLLHSRLRLVSFPRNHLKIIYNFEELLLPVISAVSAHARKDLIGQEGHVIIPVHELQVFHIQDKFLEAFIYPEDFSLLLMAQQSLT